MEISKFTIRTQHFIAEGDNGAVTILINPDYRTGAENGLIGPISTQEEFVSQMDILIKELTDIKDSARYRSLYKTNAWDMIPEKAVKNLEEVA